MTTMTTKKRTWRPVDETKTLAQRLLAQSQADPAVLAAQTALADLRLDESVQLQILKVEPTAEDPHRHEPARVRLLAIRARITVAERAVTQARQVASEAGRPELEEFHAEAAERLQGGLRGVIEGTKKLNESRSNFLIAGCEHDLRKCPMFGLDRLVTVSHQLQHVLDQWNVG